MVDSELCRSGDSLTYMASLGKFNGSLTFKFKLNLSKQREPSWPDQDGTLKGNEERSYP